jgi:aquaporin Z
MEIALTLLLVTVILGTATRERLLGPNAGIAVGATVALAGLFAAPISGASMNPARSLGPALVAWSGGGQWLYLIGPVVGAAMAVGLAWLLHGPPSPPEADAAKGDPPSEERAS